jgi:hypothetical protein
MGSTITQSKRNYWLFGLFAILISNAILLYLPVIRGYYILGSGDVLTHIGYMKDILQTSSILKNHYPIEHILGVSIHLFSGLSLPDIVFFIPPFFSFFYIFSIYLVGKTIFKNKLELMIFISISSILMFGNLELAFTPNSQAFILTSLLLFLTLKIYYGTNDKKYYVLLLLISLLIVFYHPLVTFMIILMLCLFQIMQYILEKYEKKILKKIYFTYNIFFMFAVFSLWSAYLSILVSVAKPIIIRIFGEETVESELQKNVVLISKVNVDPIYLLKLILNVYGQSIILGILSIISIGLILKSIQNQKKRWNFLKGISVVGYIVFLTLSIGMFFSSSLFGFSRIYSFATIFSLLLIPIGISLFLDNNPSEKKLTRKTIIKLLGVIIIFSSVAYFSLFNLYYSPIIKSPNLQVTKSDYFGMSTFFTYRNESLPLLESGIVSYRFYDAKYGYSARMSSNLEEKYMIPPDHFGYQNESLSLNFYNNSKYLLLNDLGRGWNPHINPEFEYKWSFRPKDFEQLKFDNKIQQVYSNRNLEIFLLP